jgi:hypothetical protein
MGGSFSSACSTWPVTHHGLGEMPGGLSITRGSSTQQYQSLDRGVLVFWRCTGYSCAVQKDGLSLGKSPQSSEENLARVFDS